MAISIETLVLAKNFAKSYTDAVVATFPRGMAYRGAVDYYSDLPSNAEVGDVYTVKYAGSSGEDPLGAEYGWGTYDGVDQWIDLGPDLSSYQPLLVSGTNIKTINGSSILGSGNLNTKELFYCTYGTTTYAEITQALSDGKLPVCFYNDIKYIYVGLSSTNRYTFSSQLFDTNRYVSVNSSDSWGIGTNNFETVSNKVTSISSSSTDAQYPSAKCVYGFVQPNPTLEGTETALIGLKINGTSYKIPTFDPTTISGYDATKTQVLTNNNGTIEWAEATTFAALNSAQYGTPDVTLFAVADGSVLATSDTSEPVAPAVE